MQTFTLASIALCPGQGCLGALPRPHGPVLWGRRPCGGLGSDLGGGKGLEGGWVQKLLGLQPHSTLQKASCSTE